MLKYKDLTAEQKKFICNGCGAKGGLVKPPSFIFKASCNHHDFKYWKGCTWKEKLKSDWAFYMWMREDIKAAAWYKKPHYHVWAFTYYTFVSIGGKKYFYFADKQKGLKDLQEEMKNANAIN